MRGENRTNRQRRGIISRRIKKIMKCLCPGEQFGVDNMVPSADAHGNNIYPTSGRSSQAGETEQQPDIGNIEEAESSLRDRGCLNYEEARALLGRYEYQKGNIEAALHVFEGIDIAAVTPKVKVTLAKRAESHKRRSQNYAAPPMSIHAVSLLLEAVFLKSKSLQCLGRYKEAADSCAIVLDIVESSLPSGLPKNLGTDCKLQDTLSRAVELLPELWKLSESPREAILSYRRALLHPWNLDPETIAKIQKQFAIFLLYSGCEANPPSLRSQIEGSFVPRNNAEEAILLLMILIKKVILKKIEWDPSILDHLSYALSISGGLSALANQNEELIPGNVDRKESYYTLALCYYGQKDATSSLNLLRKLLSSYGDPNYVPALLLASKICGETANCSEEGTSFARRAIENLQGQCDKKVGVANLLMGISLSLGSRTLLRDSERVRRQSEALQSLQTAGRLTGMSDPNVVYHLSLENAEQRNLGAALYATRCLLDLEGGSNIEGWLLLARVLSAQKRYVDAESIINIALDHSGKREHRLLLRTKAKLQIKKGELKKGIETYTRLLAVLHVQRKNLGSFKKLEKVYQQDDGNYDGRFEAEIWHDLALLYMNLSQWHDAEVCLSKSEVLNHYSASRCHAKGLLQEAKGHPKEALWTFQRALDIDPTHIPSLVSMAMVLRRLGSRPTAVAKSFLTEALRLDRMNASAWYSLGLLYKDEGGASMVEAAECFEAATFLEESSPIEPFR